MAIFFGIFIGLIVIGLIAMTIFISLPSSVLKNIESSYKEKKDSANKETTDSSKSSKQS